MTEKHELKNHTLYHSKPICDRLRLDFDRFVIEKDLIHFNIKTQTMKKTLRDREDNRHPDSD